MNRPVTPENTSQMYRGEDHPLSTDGIGYRIESELEFTVYDGVGKILSNNVDPKLRKHSNFELVVSRREVEPGFEFPIGSVVALKEGATYKGVGLVPRGTLFVIISKARTPLVTSSIIISRPQLRLDHTLSGAEPSNERLYRKGCVRYTTCEEGFPFVEGQELI
ncbi:hypothetical protein C0995_011455 [Termitomyces sp. Mi166|nr:hypothetical protein C0995_011455 [Termitomyces sp. Mi166\